MEDQKRRKMNKYIVKCECDTALDSKTKSLIMGSEHDYLPNNSIFLKSKEKLL